MQKTKQESPRPKAGLADTLAPLWRSLYSPRALFCLLVTIAICSVIGILLPQGQLPDYYVHEYGAMGASVILHLGVDHLYSSTWYVLLLGLVPLSIVARAKHIWRSAWDSFTGSKLEVLRRRLQVDNSAIVEKTVESDPQATQSALAACLRKRWYRVETTEGDDEAHWLVGRKWRYAAFGIVLVHFSVLAIAAGAVLGWWPGLAVNKTIQITEGETYRDPDGAFDFALKLNDFSIEYYPDGSTAKAYKSDISVLDQGQEIKRKTVMVNRPLSYNHFGLFQFGWGLAGFTLKVTPTHGKVETVKFPLVVAGDSERDHTRHYQVPLHESQAFIEDGQMVIIVTAFVPDALERDGEIIGSQSESPKNPSVKLALASRSITGALDLTDIGWVKQQHRATYNGGTIELADVQHYATLGVRRDYGLPLVWVGFITLFVGLVLTFYLMPRTIVARVTPTDQQANVALAAFRICASSRQWIQQQPAELQHIINSVNTQLAGSAPDYSPAARSVATGQRTDAMSSAGRSGADGLLQPDVLDELTYRIVGFAFPVLTLAIISGSAWAQTAWGCWWGWDPKETAALVTWLIYAAYLHRRLHGNWRGGPAAAFVILGFATVLFCFAGINLVPSLHSHGGQMLREGGHVVVGGFAGISPAEIWLTQGFFWAYVLAMFSYFAFAVTRNFIIGKTATFLSWMGLLALTAVLGLRTYEAGRLPFASSYGFALCFIWGVSIGHLVGERLLRTRIPGAFVLPMILVLTTYAYLVLPANESTPLIPALQNRLWLHFHVSLAIIAYGALALSCATAIMYFVKRKRAD